MDEKTNEVAAELFMKFQELIDPEKVSPIAAIRASGLFLGYLIQNIELSVGDDVTELAMYWIDAGKKAVLKKTQEQQHEA